MAQVMNMSAKLAVSQFVQAKSTKTSRRATVVVRAGAYDEELVQTAVSCGNACVICRFI
jgi:hypothetical protein